MTWTLRSLVYIFSMYDTTYDIYKIFDKVKVDMIDQPRVFFNVTPRKIVLNYTRNPKISYLRIMRKCQHIPTATAHAARAQHYCFGYHLKLM